MIAIALSMIVEITSLTPRVTLRTPAMPAQSGTDRHRDEDGDQDVELAREDRHAGDQRGAT